MRCITCNKDFHIKPSKVGRNLNCSWGCRIEYLKTKKGDKAYAWKGGWMQRGYLLQGAEKKPLHRKVMEEFLRRPLTDKEQVHHKDHNRLNNSIDNLVVLSPSEHAKLHNKTRPRGVGGKFTRAVLNALA